MCISAAIALGGAALSAYGGYEQSKAIKKQSESQAADTLYQSVYNSEIQRQQAEEIKQKAEADADKILAAAVSFRSSQAAQQAASGVVVNEGSGQIMTDDTTRLASSDALATIYDGVNGYVTNIAESRMMLKAGQNKSQSILESGSSASSAALMGGLISAGSTLANYKLMQSRK